MSAAGTTRYKLDPDRLETRFEAKYPPYDRGGAVAEANRCLYCFDAPCIAACPTSIDIPEFIGAIAHDNPVGAARTILAANLLGESCARVCPVEVLCEGDCVYNAWGRKPIAIGRLQRYAMENGARGVEWTPEAPTGRSVGLVGAGPGSLACAGRLAMLGHETVVYEMSDIPGGLNSTGIAPYKMPALDVLLEVEFVESLGVRIETGAEVGKDVTVEELLERHDAVFLGPGLGADSSLAVPGGDAEGVVGAVQWIRRLKVDADLSIENVEHAAVIGGGNTAVDAARELLQLGVPDVKIVYRRSEKEMPAYGHELEGAKREGVHLVTNVLVAEVETVDNRVELLSLVRAENGRPVGHPIGSVEADIVVVAIGQSRLAELVAHFPGVQTDERGHIVVDPGTGATGNPRVFAGGDACNGGKEVVNAVDEGQRAAAAIHRLLTQRGED